MNSKVKVLSVVGVLCAVAAGFFGWAMIQTDHVGVELSPEQARLEQAGRHRA